jgi:hypothetical protein
MYQSLDKHYDAKSAFECFVKVTPEQMETLWANVYEQEVLAWIQDLVAKVLERNSLKNETVL